MTCPKRFTHWVLVVLISAFSANLFAADGRDATTPAAPATQAEPAVDAAAPHSSIESMVADLGHTEVARREDATAGLMQREDLSDEMLRAAFAVARTPEQVQRLQRIAMHHFFRQMQVPADDNRADFRTNQRPDAAGLGISTFGEDRIIPAHTHPLLQSTGILINKRLPGFPGYAYMRQGDITIAFDGEPMPENTTRFGTMISTRKAGDEVTVRLLRDEKIITVRLKLDSLNRLNYVHTNGVTGSSADYESMQHPAFQQYLATLMKDREPLTTISIRVPQANPTVREAKANTAPADVRISIRNGASADDSKATAQP